jgi:SAM-dependent methyltransferase
MQPSSAPFRVTNKVDGYSGARILEAMKSAPAYHDCIFDMLRGAARGCSSILDFGAGDGMFARKFAEAGCCIDCVEPDPDLRSQLGGIAQNAFASIGDVPDAHYDFAFTVNVVEHIAEPELVCSELLRVLRPGGRLFVFVPAFPVLWTSLDDEVGHYRRYTRASLSRLLSDSNFAVRRVEYFDSIGFLAGLSVRILEKCGMFSYDSATISFYDRWIFPLSRKGDALFSGVAGKNVLAIAEKDCALEASGMHSTD